MRKVLFDTDIGSDIDDAVCLAYLLAQPECELMGVTTVSGEPIERAKMVSAMCKVAGVEIPIVPGLEAPMKIAPLQPEAQQATALERWEHEDAFPSTDAVQFLRDVIRSNPGEITLLTVGPLTNLGHLFKADPELPSMLDALVLMGGAFIRDMRREHEVPREWNIRCDPHAASIVYAQRPPVHRSIGLDVTMQVKMPADEVRERFQATLLRPVLDFAEVWFAERNEITFHDPLAATTLFRDDICAFARGTVAVELEDEDRLGATIWSEGDAGTPHEVATQVDVEKFFDEYFGVVEMR